MTEPAAAPASAPPLDQDPGLPWRLRMLRVQGITGMAMGALQGGPFLTAFLMELGGSNTDIGLLTSFAFLSQIVQIPGLALVQRFGKRKQISLTTMALYRLVWISLALLPLLGGQPRMGLVLGLILVGELVAALSSPAWSSLIKEWIPTSMLGSVMSKRLLFGTLASLLATALGGSFVDAWKLRYSSGLGAYSILFGLGSLVGVLGWLAVFRIPHKDPPSVRRRDLTTALKTPFQDENFRALLVFTLIWSFAINLASPFFVVYLMKELGRPLSFVTQLTVLSQVANLASLGLWGRLADRFSNKSVLAFSCPLFLVTILGWTFTTFPQEHSGTTPLLIGIYLVSGLALAGVAVASTNIALKLSPSGDAAAYLTVHSLTGALAGTFAPLLGGLLSDYFAERALSLRFHWSSAAGEAQILAFDLARLDFILALAALVGLFALHRLALVQEHGEVTEQEFRVQFFSEVTETLRGFSPLPGVRIFTAVQNIALRRLRFRRRGDRGGVPSEQS